MATISHACTLDDCSVYKTFQTVKLSTELINHICKYERIIVHFSARLYTLMILKDVIQVSVVSYLKS